MEPKVVEGVCLPITGYEEDYLDFVEQPVKLLGITGLVRQAGGEPTDWAIGLAFERAGSDWDEPYHEEERVKYRQESGRQYPPLYQVKITVEVEEMPAEYIEAHWARERARTASVPRRVTPQQFEDMLENVERRLDETE